MIDQPPGGQVLEPTEQGHPEQVTKGPFGLDFTQTFSVTAGDAGRQGMPDTGMLDIQRTAALGRAKGILEIALSRDDPAECAALIDRLLLRLIDFAICGADIGMILNGLR